MFNYYYIILSAGEARQGFSSRTLLCNANSSRLMEQNVRKKINKLKE